MLMSEEKLAIQVAQVDGVKIDDMDFTEACEDEVLQDFAADAASADKEDTRLKSLLSETYVRSYGVYSTSLILLYNAPSDCFGNLSRPMILVSPDSLMRGGRSEVNAGVVASQDEEITG